MELTRRRTLQLTGVAAIAAAGGAAGQGTARGATVLNWSDEFDRPDGEVGNGWSALRGDWRLSRGAVTSPSGTGERILAQQGFRLGESFTVAATVRNGADNTWDGLAFQVQDNGDGTQDAYLLRIVTRADTRPPSWQLVRLRGSAVESAGLLASGPVPITRGIDYTLRATAESFGVVDIAVLSGSTELASSRVVLPLGGLLTAGQVGLYCNSQGFRVERITATTSQPATAAPDPGPLQYVPFRGRPYQLPDAAAAIVARSAIGPTWPGHSVGRALLTHGDQQYVAHYDQDQRMVVAQRTLGTDTWVQQPLDSVIGWDSHNYVTMALDRAGHLHVSGNMHVVPLVYFRTQRPGDVTSLVRVSTMVDAATEQRVTYPRFFTDAAGALVFRHRDGSSGDGKDLYNIYDEHTQQWRRLTDQPLHDGEGLRNAYVDGPVLGPDGFYHVSWVWRDTPDAATNQHLSYAKSPDLRTWLRSDGSPLSLPITFATGEVIDPVPMNGGIINGNHKVGFDAEGRVTIAYHKFDDAGNTQLFIARREGRRWKIRQITQWRGRWAIGGGGTLIFEVTTAAVRPLPDGNLRVEFVCQGNRRTLILDPVLRPIAEVDTPQLPAEITQLRSTFPGMEVRTAEDLRGITAGGRHLLRWESRPSNQDRPWNPPHPEAGTLEVYTLQ